MTPPESIFIYWLILALVGGVSFIVGGHIGIRRGREKVMREIEEHWYDQHNHRL